MSVCGFIPFTAKLALLAMAALDTSFDSNGSSTTPLNTSATSAVLETGDMLKVEEVELFRGTDQGHVEQLLAQSDVRMYSHGDILIRQGDWPEERVMYLLCAGECRAYLSQSKFVDAEVVKVYEKGDYFGELAFLENKPRAATVMITSEAAQIIRVHFDSLSNELQEKLRGRVAFYSATAALMERPAAIVK